jgi:hypothetical protein
MLVYNIKRSIKILGVTELIEKLKRFKHPFIKDGLFLFLWTYFRPQQAYLFSTINIPKKNRVL